MGLGSVWAYPKVLGRKGDTAYTLASVRGAGRSAHTAGCVLTAPQGRF